MRKILTPAYASEFRTTYAPYAAPAASAAIHTTHTGTSNHRVHPEQTDARSMPSSANTYQPRRSDNGTVRRANTMRAILNPTNPRSNTPWGSNVPPNDTSGSMNTSESHARANARPKKTTDEAPRRIAWRPLAPSVVWQFPSLMSLSRSTSYSTSRPASSCARNGHSIPTLWHKHDTGDCKTGPQGVNHPATRQIRRFRQPDYLLESRSIVGRQTTPTAPPRSRPSHSRS